MSKVNARAFASVAYQQSSRSEGTEKGKGKSGSSSSSSAKGFSKAAGKASANSAGSLDDLPSVGLDVLEDSGRVDIVDQYMGNGGAAYTDEAVNQHNQIGAKAARGELLTQADSGLNASSNQNLRRQVDTLKARLEKLESQLDAAGIDQAGPAQNVQSVQPRQRVNRSFGTRLSRQTENSLSAEQTTAIGEKPKTGPFDDDLPRVGLTK